MHNDIKSTLPLCFPDPGRKILRKTGYLKDQNGIIDRYLREADNWTEHIERCKRFIRNAMSGFQKNIVVLGSGWLLDFPLEYALDKVQNLWLVDIHHPPQIVKKFSHHKQVHFITGDITGGLINLAYHESKNHKGVVLVEKITGFQPLISPVKDTLFISLNILSQLDALLCEYLTRKGKISGKDSEIIRRNIQHNHIKFLQGNRFLLLTDVEEISYSNSGSKEVIPLVVHHQLIEKDDEWIWKFDHEGYYKNGKRTDFKVIALNKATAG